VDDLVKLSFQVPAEQRLISKHGRTREKEDHKQSSNDNGSQSNRTRRPSVYAVKTHQLDSQQTKPSSRRRSTSSASSSLPHINILNKLDVVKNGTSIIPETPTVISGIHLGAVILQAGKMGAEEADCYFKQLVRGTA
jgi:protein-serine/threonine kinase